MKVKIKDVAYHLPARAVTNEEISKKHPDWDMEHVMATTGVATRYFAAEGETALDLAHQACLKLFAANPDLKDKVDGLIFCTQSPDHIMPPNSCLLQGRLGLGDKLFAFDYNLACSGYTYGLAICQGLIRGGTLSNILLVNGDTYSRYIHEEDRSCAVLFGDGAAVSWITAAEGDEGVEDIRFGSYGQLGEAFIIQAGGMRLPLSEKTKEMVPDERGKMRSPEHINMDGLGILTFVQDRVRKHMKGMLKENNLEPADLDLIILHQASKKALQALSKRMKFPDEKVFMNLENVGNTVSASIPICIKDAWDQGRLKPGDRVFLSGFGVGLSYASAIVKF